METIQAIVSTSLQDEISTACVWDSTNGTLLARYRGGGFCSKHGLSVSGGYILSCQEGKPMLHLWQLNKQHCENKRLLAPGKVNTIAFSPDSLHIALAIDEKLHLYQAPSGKLLGIGTRHFQPITVIQFCDDGTLIGCGSKDGFVTIWNLKSFCSKEKSAEPFQTFSEHTLPVTDLTFTSGNIRSRIVSVSEDRSCKVYDLVSGKVLLTVVFEARLSSVSISPVEIELYVGNSEGLIHEFSLRSPPRMLEYHITVNEKKATFHGHEKTVTCLVCSVDCCNLISGSLDETIKIWHIGSRQCLRTIPQKGPVTNIIHLLLPKSVFSHDFRPSAYIHDFRNPASIDEDEEPSLNILVSDDLLLPPSTKYSCTPRNVDADSDEINKLKSINNAIYKHAIKHILNKNPATKILQKSSQKKRKNKQILKL